MSVIKLTNGITIQASSIVSVTDNGTDTITLNLIGGSDVTQDGLSGILTNTRNALDNLLGSPPTTFGVIPLVPAYVVTITSITPSYFDVTTVAPITITGTGFNAGTVGFLYFDDSSGGVDHDGYAMVCTYVSPTQLTAVFSTVGNGILSVADLKVLITYQDTANNCSNVLLGYNPTGTYVLSTNS